jgi:tryptophan synthase alpha subunit
VSDPAVEKDEASSNQVLSEENQTRLKEVFSWLKKMPKTKSEMLITLMKYLNLLIKNSLMTSKFLWSPFLIWTIIMQQ